MSTSLSHQSKISDRDSRDAHDDFNQQAFNELDSVSLREILDQDSRPTFVLDLDSDHLSYDSDKHGIRPIFCNAALRLHDRLLENILGSNEKAVIETADQSKYNEFRSWATSVSDFDDSRDVFPLTLLYQGLIWTGSTIRQRWRVISGNQCYAIEHLPKGDLVNGSLDDITRNKETISKPSTMRDLNISTASVQATGTATSEASSTVHSNTLYSSSQPRPSKEDPSNTSGHSTNYTSTSNVSVTLASPIQGVPDWTVAKPRGILSEHMIFARNVDWAGTALGPMENWSSQFREITNIVLRNPHPAALFWGEHLVLFYNEAYRHEVAGNKHPELMGTGFSGPFSEIWEGVAPIFRECARTGTSVRKENTLFSMERYGYLEETYFSWSFTPVYGGTDRILGFYNAPFETTYQTISSRRLQTLRLLGEKLAEARSTRHFWKCVLNGLEDNHYDIPFALLYSISDSDDTEIASHSSDSTISLKSCLLEGSIGIPEGHPASPPKLDLKRSKEGFIPAFREAMRTREPTMLHTRNGSLPEELMKDIKWRGHGDPCKEVIIVPVRPTNGENIFAFLLVGVNPRRAYDEDYKDFVHMLNRQLATSLASFLLFQEEVRRSRNAAEIAALQREQLTQQIELQASRMRRMTELSPLGMYLFDPDGVLLEANERYYEMTGHARDDDDSFAFLHDMADSSKQDAEQMWADLMTDYQPRQKELQLKNPRVVPRDLAGEPIEYWVLASSQPEIGPDGKVRSVMGSIADISHMKWAQGLQDQRLREAEETKRQQNEFIDITSHELRNPLSAVSLCADDIIQSLSGLRLDGKDAQTIQDCIEAANNIALCVQHQKSIVDDVLTVSKLDSNLLLITPIPVQPVVVIQKAMSMFKPEVQAKDIDFHFRRHSSLEELEVDWVNLDPSRVLQITVNLITNAIKFTQTSPKRVISVHLSASTEQPELHSGGFDYVPTRTSLVNITAGEDWGNGRLLYLHVKVEDTGCGLTAEEKQLLFQKWTQASIRTHAEFGGSGMGLFISRQLAELHGGQIGVFSEAGVGSTFGFFIQARTADPAKHPAILSTSTSRKYLKGSSEDGPAQTVATGATSVPAPLEPTAQPSTPAQPSTLHILIVEDNPVNQRVLARRLLKAGCAVSTASNGLDALSHLASTCFQQPAGGTPLSVILMDLEMPEMDGLTCVGRIRDMQAEGSIRGHVPVIAVTANVRDEQMQGALDRGMDDVVSKPFHVPELLAKIESVWERLRGT